MRLSYILRLSNVQIGKKASLELSINAIVILILAITMLGLGLGFMRSTFGSATSEFKKVSKEVEKQLIDRLKQSEEPVSLSVFSVEMEKSSKETILMGIKNNLGCSEKDATFNIQVFNTEVEGCNAIGEGAGNMCDKVIVTTFVQQIVNSNDVGIVPINIKTDSTVIPSTLRKIINVDGACADSSTGGSIDERVELIINVI